MLRECEDHLGACQSRGFVDDMAGNLRILDLCCGRGQDLKKQLVIVVITCVQRSKASSGSVSLMLNMPTKVLSGASQLQR